MFYDLWLSAASQASEQYFHLIRADWKHPCPDWLIYFCDMHTIVQSLVCHRHQTKTTAAVGVRCRRRPVLHPVYKHLRELSWFNAKKMKCFETIARRLSDSNTVHRFGDVTFSTKHVDFWNTIQTISWLSCLVYNECGGWICSEIQASVSVWKNEDVMIGSFFATKGKLLTRKSSAATLYKCWYTIIMILCFCSQNILSAALKVP